MSAAGTRSIPDLRAKRLAPAEASKDRVCPLCGTCAAELPNIIVADLEIHGIEVRRAGKFIKLTGREFWLLLYLARNKNHALTRSMIEENAWSTVPQYESFTNWVDVYISYLRKKIDGPEHRVKLIHTLRGLGYMLGDQEFS